MKYKLTIEDQEQKVCEITFNDEALAAFIGRQVSEFLTQSIQMPDAMHNPGMSVFTAVPDMCRNEYCKIPYPHMPH